MIVGPVKTLFMDEITNGLDISTTFQILACLQQQAHITDATILISLLQPSPEAFDLFDDIIIMAEGKVVYHGPRESVVQFFERCGFSCPERKAVADFLQEVGSLQLLLGSFAYTDYLSASSFHPPLFCRFYLKRTKNNTGPTLNYPTVMFQWICSVRYPRSLLLVRSFVMIFPSHMITPKATKMLFPLV